MWKIKLKHFSELSFKGISVEYDEVILKRVNELIDTTLQVTSNCGSCYQRLYERDCRNWKELFMSRIHPSCLKLRRLFASGNVQQLFLLQIVVNEIPCSIEILPVLKLIPKHSYFRDIQYIDELWIFVDSDLIVTPVNLFEVFLHNGLDIVVFVIFELITSEQNFFQTIQEINNNATKFNFTLHTESINPININNISQLHFRTYRIYAKSNGYSNQIVSTVNPYLHLFQSYVLPAINEVSILNEEQQYDNGKIEEKDENTLDRNDELVKEQPLQKDIKLFNSSGLNKNLVLVTPLYPLFSVTMKKQQLQFVIDNTTGYPNPQKVKECLMNVTRLTKHCNSTMSVSFTYNLNELLFKYPHIIRTEIDTNKTLVEMINIGVWCIRQDILYYWSLIVTAIVKNKLCHLSFENMRIIQDFKDSYTKKEKHLTSCYYQRLISIYNIVAFRDYDNTCSKIMNIVTDIDKNSNFWSWQALRLFTHLERIFREEFGNQVTNNLSLNRPFWLINNSLNKQYSHQTGPFLGYMNNMDSFVISVRFYEARIVKKTFSFPKKCKLKS